MPPRSSHRPGDPIGTYSETALHAALKRHYAGPDGEMEVRVGAFWIDARRGTTLIEIQTANFSAMRSKLARLLAEHDVLLVHPIAQEKYLVWLDADGNTLRQRKSPMRGRLEDIFAQLVAFPELIGHPRLTLEVVLIREEAVRIPAPRRKRFDRGWIPIDRRLLEVVAEHVFVEPADFGALLPAALPDVFTARNLVSAARLPLRTAQRMLYCLRKMSVVRVEGKKGRAVTYARVSAAHDFSITQPSSPSA